MLLIVEKGHTVCQYCLTPKNYVYDTQLTTAAILFFLSFGATSF